MAKPLYKYMYRQSVNIFKSIESHLLNGELNKHKKCIQRFCELRKEEKGEYPEICPFAYTYVFWKHSFMGDKFFFSDDFFINPSKTLRHGFELLSGFFNPDLDKLIKLLLRNNNQQKIMNMALLKWIMMKYISVVYLHYYNYWRELAAGGAASKKVVPNYNELTNNRHEGIPLMILKLPYPSNSLFPESTSKFIVDHDRRSRKSKSNLNCPYKSNKDRKIKPTEISHHPMALAVNTSSNSSLTERYVRNLDIFRIMN